jgi:hypothetical protein
MSVKEKKAKEAEEPLRDIVPAESAKSPRPQKRNPPPWWTLTRKRPQRSNRRGRTGRNLPPIEPPRSWTKDEKEEFKSYPREAQEKISTAANRYESEFRRSQNEIAETRKAVEAERVAAEKARQQYEAKIPNSREELESVNQAQFGDIKTMEDVVKLQAEDPFRFQAWQVHQMRLQAAKQESDRRSGHKAQEKQSKRAAYEAEQNKALGRVGPRNGRSEKG